MSISSKIQSLITAANSVTGESRTDLTAAVQDLKDGYGGLPAEYQQVEYISASGGQVIDTEYVATANDDIEATIYIDSTMPQWYGFMGAYNSSGAFCLTVDTNRWNFSRTYNNPQYIRQTYNTKIKVETEGTRMTYRFNKTSFYYSDDTGSTTDCDISFCIFGMRESATDIQKNGIGRVYSFIIFNRITAEKKRELVPCYRKSDKEIGLFDLVNQKFYTNKGTGSFTCYPAPPSN